MVADIRATTICNLGTVIQGSLADEAISVGQGLIRCRGQLVIEGMISPAAGSVVELAYIREDRIVRIPRRLRVISHFTDPFANTTTVQIGDKLVWLADKGPSEIEKKEPVRFPTGSQLGDTYVETLLYPNPDSGDDINIQYTYNGICWQAEEQEIDWRQFNLSSSDITAAEEAPGRPMDEELRAPITISALTILRKCLLGLGISSTGSLQLLNHYEPGEVEIDQYVNTIERLLSTESLVGFLDAGEVLRITSLVLTAPSVGIQISEDDIVEIGPIGSTEVPPSSLIELEDEGSATDEPARDPDPEPPTAEDFRYGSALQGSTLTIPYSVFLFHSQYDFYLRAFNRVTVSANAVEGCTAVNDQSGVTVQIGEDFAGTAQLTYTVNDSINDSNIANVYITVLDPLSLPEPGIEDPELPNQPENPEGTKQSPPFPGGGDTFQEFSGRPETIYISYEDPQTQERKTAEASSYPRSITTEVYGRYGEVLQRWEGNYAGGASAAGNVYSLWLSAGEAVPDPEVYVINVTDYVYDYGFEKAFYPVDTPSLGGQTTVNVQAKQCQTTGGCAEELSLPENPQEGDTFIYGECYYVWTNNQWTPSEQPGEGEQTQQEPKRPDISDWIATQQPELIGEETRTYEHAYYIAGAINWPKSLDAQALPPLYSSTDLTTEITRITYRKDPVNNTTLKTQATWKALYKTAEGQQYLASETDSVANATAVSNRYIETYYRQLFWFASGLRYQGEEVFFGRGLPQVPLKQSVTNSVSTSDESQGSTGIDYIPASETSVRTQRDSTGVSATPPLKSTMPRTWSEEEGYVEGRDQWAEYNDRIVSLRYARAVRTISYGNRYGMSLQVVPWSLPMYPLDPVYLNIRSVTGAYRANGITIAFSADGILANCDALFVGAVGGTGTPYFPLPEGAVLEPAPASTVDEAALPPNSIAVPELFDVNNPGTIWTALPTDDEQTYPVALEPDYIIPPVLITVAVNLGVRIGLTFKKFEYSLTPVIKDQAVGITLGIVASRETPVEVPATAITLAALAPIISTGAVAKPPAQNVSVAAVAPKVSTGANVIVPFKTITVAPAEGPVVPRLATQVNIPAANISVAGQPATLPTAAIIAAPAAAVTVAAQPPVAGGNLGDNYGLTALIEDDLLQLL